MSGAQSWSVKGIDPKVREAAREAAARQGMSLGEYLNQALQNHQPSAPTPGPGAPRPRTPRLTPHPYDEEDQWQSRSAELTPRPLDPTRLAQRIEAIERRTQLAVTGLDRAVSSMDRSVLGLAARVEEAESVSQESAERISEALEQFRVAGETLSGRLATDAADSREALDGAKYELSAARERLEHQVATAEEVARRAEAAAEFLATEMNNREAALDHKLGLFEDKAHDALATARAAAEDAARQASEAASDAVSELRQLHARLADRVAEAESNTRRTVESALHDVRTEQAALTDRIVKEVKSSTLGEVNARIATVEALKSEHAALISRIEKAEANSRESTAGLRQAAGAAIADLRNAQLGLAARVKQVEDGAGRAGALDVADLRVQQAEIASRLATLESKPAPNVDSALARFEKRLEEIAQRSDEKPGQEAFAQFERRLQDIASRSQNTVTQDKLDEVGASVKTLDQNFQRLADRLAETETTANSAIRTLEQTVSGLSEKIAGVTASQETEALRALLEHRLDEMAQSVSTMVGEARTEIAGQVQSVLEGGADGEGFEGALADVNRRLAAAERRQAQTIEAISIEIKRMSETVDRRLRSVEDRNDDAAAVAVREELARMGQTLEARFEEIERREAAAFDRMGLEVGRLSERLEERVGAVETRSAQAIEHVGDQVARMAERFNQRHEILARDLGERMLDSEERSGARVSEAIASMMQRLGEVEERSAEAVAPVQKAMSSIASRLDGLAKDEDEDIVDIPTPSRRAEDFADASPFAADAFEADPFEDAAFEVSPSPTSYAPTPMETAQPMRAAPLPPLSAKQSPPPIEDDIYFAEDIEPIPSAPTQAEPAQMAAPSAPPETKSYLTVEPDPEGIEFEDVLLEQHDAFAPPPPEDDDPFWAPEPEAEASPAAAHETHDFDADAEVPPAPADEPALPPGRHDYLKAARKAAQDQSTPQSKAREAVPPTYSLRGSSRIVLWGAASAIALLIAGGAWYLNMQDHARRAAPPAQPEPDVTPPTQALPPPATPYDPSATPPDTTASPDTTTAQPSAAPAQQPTSAAPAAPPPVAQAAPLRAAPVRATVAAGPLPPRNVSLEQAAQNGDLVAEYELGLQRIAANRSAEGMGLLRRAADHGMAMAQYRLAKIYERGEGVPVDLTQARQWTERAAGGGNRRAMHDLGVYYARGEGAPLDEQAAFRWFRQAAELGVTDSQYNLGVLYQQGRGIGASPSEALFWFLVAARQGDADATARAAQLESQLPAQQVAQAHGRAESFRARAVSGPANGEFGPRPWSTAPATPGA
ncbi:MAG: hypothetical protein ABUS57_05090 [Pseudomonadota bacterium]